MKKLKKLLFVITILSLTFVMAISVGCGKKKTKSESQIHNDFIEEIGGVSETYVGEVSEAEYQDATTAATACLQEQIVGEQEVTVVNTVSTTLNNEQVAALNLPAEVAQGAESVEEIEIEYAEVAQAGGLSNGLVGSGVLYDGTQTTKKVKVYIIKYADHYKYFTPAPVTGGTITKSYYDSVFNSEKYENCTLVTTAKSKSVGSTTYPGGSQSVNETINSKQVLKIADGKIYLEMKTQGADFFMDMYLYLEETASGPIVYVRMVSEEEVYAPGSEIGGTIPSTYATQQMDTGWIEGDIEFVGFTDIKQLTPFYNQYLDYTYFTKTDYGFDLNAEHIHKYLEANSFTEDEDGEFIFGETDLFVKYYVSEGVLSGMRQSGSYSMSMIDEYTSTSMTITVDATMTCTDYGTTVIENPITSGGNSGSGSGSGSGTGSGTGSGVGGGGVVQPGTTTVTAQEWADALDFTSGGAYSYTTTMPSRSLEYKFDGAILYCKETTADTIREEYMFEDGGVYYELEKENDNPWTTREISEDEYLSEVYEALTVYAQMFTFDEFTYNDANQSYEAESLAGGMLQDVALTFRNGYIMSIQYQMQMDDISIGQLITFNYDAFTLTLPQVSGGNNQGTTNETTSGITGTESGLVGKVEG